MLKVFVIFAVSNFISNGDCEFVKCIADCIKLKDCHEAKMFLKDNGTHPEICGFSGTEPLVCCAAKNEKTLFDIHYAGLRRVEKKCKELNAPSIPHRNKKPPLGGGSGYGYGGWQVTNKEYTFMTVLGYGNPKNPLYRCGGVLVQKNVVITAAHCAEINGEPPSVARIGTIALSSNDSIPIEVVKVIRHPNYNNQTDQNDIAIIILATNSKENPACLFRQRLNLRHDNRTIALGFGTTTFAGRFSDNLIKTYYNIIQKSLCEKEYQGQPLLDSQLCVLGERRYFENGTSLVQDTCQGDSGGPLVLDRKHSFVVGIVSYGPGCGSEIPGIYTHIASYMNWVDSTIRQEANNIGYLGCLQLEPPYITVSLCTGGEETGKSCSKIAYRGSRYSYYSSGISAHVVKIGYRDTKNPVYECDGFLVDKNVVITAAQCTKVNGMKPLVVQLLYSTTRVVKVIPHPNYEYKKRLHDIAILFLAENLEGVPVCLWSSSLDLKSENEVFAVGFGTTSFDGPLLTELLLVNVTIADKSTCNREYNNKPMSNSELCLLSKTDYIGEDTYQVNSGGPLIFRSSNKNNVIGIVSYVDNHVIYTNITPYLDWIESVIWPEETRADTFYIA